MVKMIYNHILILTIVFVCGKYAHCQNVTFDVKTNCISDNVTMTMTAVYSGGGTVTGVEWYYSGRSAINLVILASTCTVFGGIDPGYPPASRMTYQCPSTGLPPNTFKLLLLNATKAESTATWGATFRLAIGSSPSTVTDLVTIKCDCECISDGLANQITCSVAVASTPLVIIVAFVLILFGRIGTIVAWKLTGFDIGVIVPGVMVGMYAVIVGAIAVSKNGDCRNCPSCDMSRCDVNNGLGIASIVLGMCGVCVTVGLIVNRRVSDKPKQQNETVKDEASDKGMMKEQKRQQEKTAV